jgi:tetratricopeptide (TPR) repeat protein
MGNFEEALQEYNSILELNPHFVQAKLSKLSLLIELRRFQEVMPEFPGGQPKSELDWKFYFLKALALDATSNGKKGDALFGNGIRNAPFARQRRLFAAALGRKKLLHSQFSKSLKVIESEPGEVSNVIWLHALAASGHKARAKSTFEDIISNETSASIIELSREIVSRYNIVDVPSRRTREWIFEAEQKELLLEAA